MNVRARIAVGAAVVVFAPTAAAFCRTTTCDPRDPAQACEVDPTTLCVLSGIQLAWPTACVSYGIQQDGSGLRSITYDQAKATIDRAFQSWLTADCGGAFPQISLDETSPIICRQAEYNQNSPNANVWMFRDDAWPYGDSLNTIALTTVTYNTENGEIYDADVEINSSGAEITVGDANVRYDLESIAAHEAGHFLGLAHSLDPDATMLFSYRVGDTSLRSLGADDNAAICATYPPGRVVRSADCTPRHGFSSQCGEDQPSCECNLGRSAPSKKAVWVAAAAGLFALGRLAHLKTGQQRGIR